MTRIVTLLATAACALTLASGARADTEQFHAALTTGAQVPPVTGSASGTFTGTFDTATRTLTYEIDYTGLTGPAMAAHFHGPAAAGANAGVLVPIKAPLASPIKGTAKLTTAEAKDLEAGMIYVNIHTAANKGGEIRGQVEK